MYLFFCNGGQMNLLRKKTLFTLLLLGTLLITSFSFPVRAECSCCTSHECMCGYTENNQLHEKFFQDHSHGKSYPCIGCGSIPAGEPLSVSGYSTPLEKKQQLTSPQVILEKPFPLSAKSIPTYMSTPSPFTSPPLFLINSTFLL
jgi:hypothetical protein